MAEFINTIDAIGDDALADMLITRTITEYNDNTFTQLGDYALARCDNLVRVKLPALTSISRYLFNGSSNLRTADFTAVTSIAADAFKSPNYMNILIIRNTQAVCSLSGTLSSGYSPPIQEGGTGYIYVPSALVDNYKAATNWSTYASQFRALEDYTVDGTTTGELDPNLI